MLGLQFTLAMQARDHKSEALERLEAARQQLSSPPRSPNNRLDFISPIYHKNANWMKLRKVLSRCLLLFNKIKVANKTRRRDNSIKNNFLHSLLACPRQQWKVSSLRFPLLQIFTPSIGLNQITTLCPTFSLSPTELERKRRLLSSVGGRVGLWGFLSVALN